MSKSDLKILHLDVETAPNTAHVWGLFNQNVSIKQVIDSSYVLCWSAKWHNKKEIYFDSIRDSNACDMMKKMWHLLDEADAITSYNGRKFDVPTIQKEFALLGFSPPSPYHHIDLFSVVRKEFRFPSKKLDYVAQALGLGSKVKHEGHELWIGCMEGDPSCWKKMERYNKMDVKLLEKLYKKLLPWIKTHPNHALYMDTDRPVCTNCGSNRVQSRGVTHTKTQTYRRFMCADCGTWLRSRNNVTMNKENVLTQVS